MREWEGWYHVYFSRVDEDHWLLSRSFNWYFPHVNDTVLSQNGIYPYHTALKALHISLYTGCVEATEEGRLDGCDHQCHL